MIKIIFDGSRLMYKEIHLRFDGTAALSILCNLLEIANKAHHQNRYINVGLAPHSIKMLGDGWHLNWSDVDSFGLGEVIDNGILEP